MIDVDAAARVKQFLRGVKGSQPPVYFHSPGGVAEQAYAIARILRARKAVGRVGQTIADAYRGTQSDDVCVKIKTAHDEVHASLATRNAMCNSACVDLLLGATTREVAPDTVLGVHSSKTVLEFKRVVTERQRNEAMVRAHERGFRAHREFVQSMGSIAI